MSDLDYVKVVGRFGLNAGDIPAGDSDPYPDTKWCTSGTITFTPLISLVKVLGGLPSPWTGGNANIVATVDENGYVSRGGADGVWLLDLASPKVSPRVPLGFATHRVSFSGMSATGEPVAFESATVRLSADTVNTASGAVDLTEVIPHLPGVSVATSVGPRGQSVTDLNIDEDGHLIATLSNGAATTTVDAGVVSNNYPQSIQVSASAAKTLAVERDAAYHITITNNAVVTLSGAPGTGCTFDVSGNGTINDKAVVDGGHYVAYRFNDVWLVREISGSGISGGSTGGNTGGNTGGGGGGGNTTTGVAALPVTFNDASGTSQDTYTVPSSTGVIYKIGNTTKAAGTYPGTGTVTVNAVAASGYNVTGTSSWSHTFDTSGGSTPPPTNSGWQTLASWNFASPDGTLLNGLAPTSGSGALAVTSYNSGDQQIDVLGGKARLQSYSYFFTAGVATTQAKGIAFQADVAMANSGSKALGSVVVGNDLGSQSLLGNNTGFNVDGSGVVTGSHLGAGSSVYTPASGSPTIPQNSTIRAEFIPGANNQGCTGALYADGVLIGSIVATGFTWVGRAVGLYAGQSYHVDSFLDNVMVEGLL